jgi:hypothetical protein
MAISTCENKTDGPRIAVFDDYQNVAIELADRRSKE